MGDSFFGTSTTTAGGPLETDPTLKNLFGTRQDVINQVLAGQIPSPAYFQHVLIPSTMNALTVAGLGRSGAVGEAVSNAVLGRGLDFLQAILGANIPSPFGTPPNQTTSKHPGVSDYLGMLGGGLLSSAPFLPGLSQFFGLSDLFPTGRLSDLWASSFSPSTDVGSNLQGTISDILRQTDIPAAGDSGFDFGSLFGENFFT